MAIEQRLPVVNSDDGIWGDDLNAFLGKEHFNADPTLTPGASKNGGHKTITIQAGTGTANTAPLKFTTGTLLSAPEAGAVEYYDNLTNGNLYVTYTQATVATRLKIAAYNDASGATGDVYYRDANGNFARLPVGSNTNVLTLAGGVPTWATAGAGGTGTSRGL